MENRARRERYTLDFFREKRSSPKSIYDVDVCSDSRFTAVLLLLFIDCRALLLIVEFPTPIQPIPVLIKTKRRKEA